eukprot:8369-Heterococcus_DN1.PRE.2
MQQREACRLAELERKNEEAAFLKTIRCPYYGRRSWPGPIDQCPYKLDCWFTHDDAHWIDDKLLVADSTRSHTVACGVREPLLLACELPCRCCTLHNARQFSRIAPLIAVAIAAV